VTATNHATSQPLLLKRLIAERGITVGQLIGGFIKGNGKPISRSAISLLMNHGRWPTLTPRADLAAHIEGQLRGLGVDDESIAAAWGTDEEGDDHLPAHLRRKQGAKLVAVKRPPQTDDFQTPENEMLTPEAKQLFRLPRDPFTDEVQGSEDVFLSADQRYIREAMYQAARHGGFLAVVGECGAGKTTLRRDLIERIHRDGESVVIVQPRTIDKTQLTAAAIWPSWCAPIHFAATLRPTPSACSSKRCRCSARWSSPWLERPRFRLVAPWQWIAHDSPRPSPSGSKGIR